MVNPLIGECRTTQRSRGKKKNTINYFGDQIIQYIPNYEIREKSFLILLNSVQQEKQETFIRLPIYFSAASRVIWDYFGIAMDDENRAYASLKQIKKDLGYSANTASPALLALREHDYIRVIEGACYMVNPNAMAKCSAKDRTNLVDNYCELDECKTQKLVKNISEWYTNSKGKLYI